MTKAETYIYAKGAISYDDHGFAFLLILFNNYFNTLPLLEEHF
jgi:hypothetical protein